MMDDPTVNTEAEELDVQDEEAEVMSSASISTEAKAQGKETQDEAMDTPTQTHSRGTTNCCIAPTKVADMM